MCFAYLQTLGTRKHYEKQGTVMLWATLTLAPGGYLLVPCYFFNPWALSSMWMLLLTHIYLPKHFCRTCTPSAGFKPCQKEKWFTKIWEARQWVWGVHLTSKFFRSHSNQASVECAGQLSLINGGPPLQPIQLKGCIANILVPDTTAHIVEFMLRWFRAVLAA